MTVQHLHALPRTEWPTGMAPDLQEAAAALAAAHLQASQALVRLVVETVGEMVTTPAAGPVALNMVEAAELLSISVPTLKELVRKGLIPQVLIGRRRLISRASLERYVAAHEIVNVPGGRIVRKARAQ